MSEAPRLPHEKSLAIARALEHARIPHAFAGAIALAFAAEPRGTIDVDVNLFVSVERWVRGIVGVDGPRTAKLRRLIESHVVRGR